MRNIRHKWCLYTSPVRAYIVSDAAGTPFTLKSWKPQVTLSYNIPYDLLKWWTLQIDTWLLNYMSRQLDGGKRAPAACIAKCAVRTGTPCALIFMSDGIVFGVSGSMPQYSFTPQSQSSSHSTQMPRLEIAVDDCNDHKLCTENPHALHAMQIGNRIDWCSLTWRPEELVPRRKIRQKNGTNRIIICGKHTTTPQCVSDRVLQREHAQRPNLATRQSVDLGKRSLWWHHQVRHPCNIAFLTRQHPLALLCTQSWGVAHRASSGSLDGNKKLQHVDIEIFVDRLLTDCWRTWFFLSFCTVGPEGTLDLITPTWSLSGHVSRCQIQCL